MPIFDFKCCKCGNVAEEIRPADIDVIVCPECGAAARKQISGDHMFVLKGGGWEHCGGENKPGYKDASKAYLPTR